MPFWFFVATILITTRFSHDSRPNAEDQTEKGKATGYQYSLLCCICQQGSQAIISIISNRDKEVSSWVDRLM